MATKKIDKYTDYRYKIVTPEELREARWLIAQGFFEDMDDYIERVTRFEKKRLKEEDAEKAKLTGGKKRDKAA